MTANALPGDRERCIEAGMNDHMTKPIDPDILTSKLMQWIRPRRPAAPSPSETQLPSPQEPTLSGLPFLNGIDGLDPRLGLHQAMDREKLYLSLLNKFIQGEQDWASRMAAALDRADIDTARRLAHTLKGVSAQVGALRMRDMAQSLEHALEHHEPGKDITPLLREAGSHLAMLVEILSKRLPVGDAASTPAATDTASLTALCSQLIEHFEHDDFASGQLVDDHEGLLRSVFGRNFEQFANAVHGFDFSTALDLLKAAVADHGIPL
jgi:two-component system sensor histidine kinase/response regulator